MYNSVIKTAIKFLNKDIKKKVSFETIADYLKFNGYAVIFYDPETGNEFIDKYNLSEYSKSVQAFTIRKKDIKIIFISNIAPHEDKLLLLLHETGHALLNHMDRNILTANTRLQDMEADAFAYTVLNPPKSKVPVIFLTAVLGILISVIGAYHTMAHNQPVPSEPALITTETSVPINTITNTSTKKVYVTQYGERYHREGCRYVKGKNAMQLDIENAQKQYMPCMVCNP